MEDGSEIRKDPKLMLLLSKQLLNKYGVVSDFAIKQLENWPFICCDISIWGYAEVNGIDKEIVYKIYTHKKYKTAKEKVIELSSWEKAWTFFKVPSFLYKKQIKTAKENLTNWTKTLMWDADTKVKVIIDEQEA